MNLYFARHGEPDKNQDDSKRKLTEAGKTKVFQFATKWHMDIPKFDLIISSPYKRTRQTAEIIKIIFNIPEEIMFDDKLGPGCFSEYIDELVNCYPLEDIIIIGHEPDLSYHVSYFTGNSEAIEFGHANMVKISFNGNVKADCGKLEKVYRG